MQGKISLFDKLSQLSLEQYSDNGGSLSFIVVNGHARLIIGEDEFNVCKGDMLICPPMLKLSESMLSADFDTFGLYLSSDFREQLRRVSNVSWNVQKMHTNVIHFHLEEETIQRLKPSFLYIQQKVRDTQLPNREKVLDYLFRSVMYEFFGTIEMNCNNDNLTTKNHSSAQQIFSRFISMIEQSQEKHRPVNYWADQLHISAKYLSAVCQKIAGCGAKDIIEEAVLIEARKLLTDHTYSISQISDQLGFNNPSHFGSFIRKRIGKSPIDLRD